MTEDTQRRAPERAILEYLVGTGLITATARHVATVILARQPLSESQQHIFQKQIAAVWFYFNCVKCHEAICIEEIPEAIESGNYRCGRCRQLHAGAKLSLAAGRMGLGRTGEADAQLRKIRAAAFESWQRRHGRQRLRPS